MVTESKYGKCHLCGEETELTFEHIPPKSAFNNTGVLIAKYNYTDELPSFEEIPKRARTFQKGMGTYSLCKKCNNRTGKWYGAKFVDFCRKGMRILEASNYKPSLFYFSEIYPLAIIKQIISMFTSINLPEFRESHGELCDFVLDYSRKYISPRYKIYMYFNITGMYRAVPLAAKMELQKSTLDVKKVHYLSEISFPPFGYLLAVDSETYG